MIAIFSNLARLNGELAVSRSFGDKNYISYGLIAEPEITLAELNNDSRYLLLGTDGFWDVSDSYNNPLPS